MLTWKEPDPNCAPVVSYNVEFESIKYITSNLYYTFSGLINCSPYTFSVSALDDNGNESTLKKITAIPEWPNPPLNLTGGLSQNISIITLNWAPPNPNCSPPTSYTLYWSNDNNNFSSIPNIPSNVTLYDFTGVTLNTPYYFYMVSVNLIGISNSSSRFNIIPRIYSIGGDANYTEQINGNDYTLTFNANSNSNGIFTLTFYINISDVLCMLVGGGGGGRGAAYYPEDDPSLELLVGGVGGGGASSLRARINVSKNNSYDLLVGKGGAGGLTTTGPPEAKSGHLTTVSLNGVTFFTAPGGNTSTSMGSFNTGPTGTVYYGIGALVASLPIINIAVSILYTATGGASRDGSGIIYSSASGTSNARTNGGNGYDANNPSGNLPYGGGGGTNRMNNETGDTYTGSVVSFNDKGGLQGTQFDGVNQATYLRGNQSSSGYGNTETPGFGSGGGGGGLYWRHNGADYFGEGGAGGDGLMIITFTIP